MWILIEPLLEKFAVEEVVRLLIASGFLTKTEGTLVDGAESLKLIVENIKIYRIYPDDPPGQTNQPNFVTGLKSL